MTPIDLKILPEIVEDVIANGLCDATHQPSIGFHGKKYQWLAQLVVWIVEDRADKKWHSNPKGLAMRIDAIKVASVNSTSPKQAMRS